MIFNLPSEELVFPDPSLAEEDGLLAVGGDLSIERLLLAYTNGIFPWYSEDTPILWYSPHERFVIPMEEIRISKSMRQVLRSGRFHYTYDQSFGAVLRHCAETRRKDQDGTWITEDMFEAYMDLHHKGYAHSIEVWNQQENLVGGLYGVSIGKIFSGESMFSLEPNASKYALIKLATHFGLDLIDCQVHSDHLERMGARFISQNDYRDLLAKQHMQAHGFQQNLIP